MSLKGHRSFSDVLQQWMLKNLKGYPLLARQGPALAGPRRSNSVKLLGVSCTAEEYLTL